MAQPFLDFEVGTRAEIEADDGTRALAEPMGNILACDDQIFGPIILAAKHDVRMGMTRVAMVGGDPVELRPEVLFHLRHQPAHERL